MARKGTSEKLQQGEKRSSPVLVGMLVWHGSEDSRRDEEGKPRCNSKIKLWNRETVVGRGKKLQARIRQSLVSRKHATIRVFPGTGKSRQNLVCELVDNSTNGTYVNGTRIDQHYLEDGDLIAFGAIGPLAKVGEYQDNYLGSGTVFQYRAAGGLHWDDTYDDNDQDKEAEMEQWEQDRLYDHPPRTMKSEEKARGKAASDSMRIKASSSRSLSVKKGAKVRTKKLNKKPNAKATSSRNKKKKRKQGAGVDSNGMRTCEMCGVLHKWKWGSGRFCAQSCAAQYSRKRGPQSAVGKNKRGRNTITSNTDGGRSTNPYKKRRQHQRKSAKSSSSSSSFNASSRSSADAGATTTRRTTRRSAAVAAAMIKEEEEEEEEEEAENDLDEEEYDDDDEEEEEEEVFSSRNRRKNRKRGVKMEDEDEEASDAAEGDTFESELAEIEFLRKRFPPPSGRTERLTLRPSWMTIHPATKFFKVEASLGVRCYESKDVTSFVRPEIHIKKATIIPCAEVCPPWVRVGHFWVPIQLGEKTFLREDKTTRKLWNLHVTQPFAQQTIAGGEGGEKRRESSGKDATTATENGSSTASINSSVRGKKAKKKAKKSETTVVENACEICGKPATWGKLRFCGRSCAAKLAATSGYKRGGK